MTKTTRVTRTAVIFCSIDIYANAIKPQKIKEHLNSKGFEVLLLNTSSLNRSGDSGVLQKLPGLSFHQLWSYLLEISYALATISNSKFTKKYVGSILMTRIIKTRAILIYTKFKESDLDLIVCESNSDIGFVAMPRIARLQILDLPAPSAEEKFYGGEFTKKGFEKFKNFEASLYAKADALSFHWHSYEEFVRNTKYNGENYISMGYGTEAKKLRAKFGSPYRVIFLGFLSGYWVNMPLLERLCALYPHIDVYGGPMPPKGSKINFKGYAPTLDVMADYQFGLTTITSDQLRCHSFSSKHLEYISYGLPVLTPDWRHDALLDNSSIYFNEENFLTRIADYSNQKKWQNKSRQALNTARNLSWEKAFQELDVLINKTL